MEDNFESNEDIPGLAKLSTGSSLTTAPNAPPSPPTRQVTRSMTANNKRQTRRRGWIPKTYKTSKHNKEVAKRLTEVGINNHHEDDHSAVTFSTEVVSDPKTPKTFKNIYTKFGRRWKPRY